MKYTTVHSVEQSYQKERENKMNTMVFVIGAAVLYMGAGVEIPPLQTIGLSILLGIGYIASVLSKLSIRIVERRKE